MSLPDSALRQILLDLLFLVLAGTLAFWFRSWLREQKRELDRRLTLLEDQQRSLHKLGQRLADLCRTLEQPAPATAARVAGSTAPPKAAGTVPAPRPAETGLRQVGASGEGRTAGSAAADPRREEGFPDPGREAYRRAREMLAQGLSAAEISRRVGLRVSDVNALMRMREAGRR